MLAHTHPVIVPLALKRLLFSLILFSALCRDALAMKLFLKFLELLYYLYYLCYMYCLYYLYYHLHLANSWPSIDTHPLIVPLALTSSIIYRHKHRSTTSHKNILWENIVKSNSGDDESNDCKNLQKLSRAGWWMWKPTWHSVSKVLMHKFPFICFKLLFGNKCISTARGWMWKPTLYSALHIRIFVYLS